MIDGSWASSSQNGASCRVRIQGRSRINYVARILITFCMRLVGIFRNICWIFCWFSWRLPHLPLSVVRNCGIDIESIHIDLKMRSTEIINRTTRDMDIKVGNCRYFVKLTTVAKNQSYTVHVDYNDTFREFSLGGDAAAGKSVIVNSDECVDNKKIIIREVDGEFEVDMEPRVRPALRASPVPSPAACGPIRRPYLFLWRLWIF